MARVRPISTSPSRAPRRSSFSKANSLWHQARSVVTGTVKQYAETATTLVRDLGGPAKGELGVVLPLWGEGEPAVKLAIWVAF